MHPFTDQIEKQNDFGCSFELNISNINKNWLVEFVVIKKKLFGLSYKAFLSKDSKCK